MREASRGPCSVAHTWLEPIERVEDRILGQQERRLVARRLVAATVVPTMGSLETLAGQSSASRRPSRDMRQVGNGAVTERATPNPSPSPWTPPCLRSHPHTHAYAHVHDRLDPHSPRPVSVRENLDPSLTHCPQPSPVPVTSPLPEPRSRAKPILPSVPFAPDPALTVPVPPAIPCTQSDDGYTVSPTDSSTGLTLSRGDADELTALNLDVGGGRWPRLSRLLGWTLRVPTTTRSSTYAPPRSSKARRASVGSLSRAWLALRGLAPNARAPAKAAPMGPELAGGHGLTVSCPICVPLQDGQRAVSEGVAAEDATHTTSLAVVQRQ